MNINEYKKYLKSVHNTLDDPSMNNQLRDRLSESPVCDMKEYKPDATKYKSSHEPTTASGDSLRPNSKTAEKMEKLKEEEEVEISECVVEYFENYFGDNLNEDTSDEDIMGAVYDLIDLVEVVYNEAHTLLPDHPDVVKWWGGREKFDKLNARLGNKKKIDRKPPKVEVTRKPLKKKKKKGQLELFAANQYFEAYFGQELNENISQNDIIKAVEDLAYLCEAVCDAVGLKKNLTVDEAIIKPKNFVMPSTSGNASIERGSGASDLLYGTKKRIPTTWVPKKYADSTTKIRTLKPSKKGSLKLTQSGKKRVEGEPLDPSRMPIVGPGQPDHHL